MRAFVTERGFALERASQFAIANTARVLKLDRKGRLERGCDAIALVLRRDTLETETFLKNRDRRNSLYGGKS